MPASSIQQILLQTIDEQFPLYLHDWQSISTQIYTSPASKIQDIWLSLLRHHGFFVQYLDSSQLILYGEYMVEAPQTLLFYSKYTPSMAMQQGTFPLLSHLAAIRAYTSHFGRPPVNIKWLIDGQDNVSSAYLTQLLTQHRSLLQTDSCILYTTKRETGKEAPQPELFLGLKGHLQAEVSLQTATSRTIPTTSSAIAPDAAWQLVWSLAALKDAREDILLEGFYDQVQAPEDAIIESIAQLPDTSTELKRIWGTPHLLMDLQGTRQHYAYWLTPTCAITLLNSPPGAQTGEDPKGEFDLLPTQAYARLDFRLVPTQDPYEIFTKLQQHFDTHSSYPVQCRLLSASRPISISAREPLVQNWVQAMHTISRQPPVLLPLATELHGYAPISNLLTRSTLGIALPTSSDATLQERLRVQMKQHVLFLASYGKPMPDHSNQQSSH